MVYSPESGRIVWIFWKKYFWYFVRNPFWLLNDPKIEIQIPAVWSIKLIQILWNPSISSSPSLLSWIRHGRSHSLIAFDHDRLTLTSNHSSKIDFRTTIIYLYSHFHLFTNFRKKIIFKQFEHNCENGSRPEVVSNRPKRLAKLVAKLKLGTFRLLAIWRYFGKLGLQRNKMFHTRVFVIKHERHDSSHPKIITHFTYSKVKYSDFKTIV